MDELQNILTSALERSHKAKFVITYITGIGLSFDIPGLPKFITDSKLFEGETLMKRFTFKRQLILLGCFILALCVAIPIAAFAKAASAEAAPLTGGKLKSGKPVHGVVSSQNGVSYTFTAVVDQHVTLAITNPHVSPSGSRLQMNVYDSSGAQDANGVIISTSPTEIDFTPTADEAGTTTVVISPYDFETTGSFTLTYTAG